MSSLDVYEEHIEVFCRTCLTAEEANQETEMINIFTKKHDVSPADLIKTCTAIKITKTDTLPNHICNNCFAILSNFYIFRKEAEAIDIQLRNKFNTDHKKGSKILKVKEEDQCEPVQDNVFDDSEIYYDNEDIIDESNTIETRSESPEFKPDIKSLQNSFKLSDKKLEITVDVKPVKSETESQLKVKNIKRGRFKHSPCSKVFKQSSKLVSSKPQNGEIGDVKTNKFSCLSCPATFDKEILLSNHLEKHIHNIKKEYTCIVCKEKFKGIPEYVTHMLSHSKDDNTNRVSQNSGKIFKCDFCSSTFDSVKLLSTHMRKHTSKDKTLTCHLCEKEFATLKDLLRHEKSHDAKHPFKCLLCPKSFVTDEILQKHVEKHKEEKNNVCPFCKKMFKYFTTLKTHIVKHIEDKKCLCSVCGKKFNTSANLSEHLKRHLGIREFACDYCPKKFITKGELKTHMTSHTGDKRFCCDKCGAKFTKRWSLIKHTNNHLGKKALQCSVCGKGFQAIYSLKRHLIIHTGEKPFECEYCKKAYTQKNDLVKHLRTHLGVLMHKCDKCSERFRLETELKLHMCTHEEAILTSVQ